MSNPAISQLVWKESKEKYGLAIAAGVSFALAMTAWAWSWSSGEANHWDAPKGLLTLLNMWVNTFAVIVGVMLFSPEKEGRTFQLLGTFPISGIPIAVTKIFVGAAFVLANTVFCYGLAFAAASAIGVQFPLAGMGSADLVGQLLSPLESFCWGVFWSMTLTSTLFAILMATACVLVSLFIANLFGGSSMFYHSQANYSWWIRIPVLVFLIVAIARNSKHWLRESSNFSRANATTRGTRFTLASAKLPILFSRLLWQSFKQFKLALLLAIPILVLFTIAFSLFPTQSPDLPYLALSALGWLMVVPLTLGLLTFHFDQQKQSYHFFQQQVEHGRWLWLSRLIIPLSVSTFAALIGSMVTRFSVANLNSNSHHVGSYFVYFLHPLEYMYFELSPIDVFILVLTAFAIGQYCSMMIRPALVSFFMGVCGFVFAVAWVLLLLHCGAGFIWFLLPLALVLIVTTWQHSPSWLADRRNFKPWLAVALTCVLLISGLMYMRATEIQPISSKSLLVEFSSHQSEMSKKLASAAAAISVRMNEDVETSSKWLEKNQASLKQIHNALSHEHKFDIGRPYWNSQTNKTWETLNLLSVEFDSHLKKENLNLAFQSIKSMILIEKETATYYRPSQNKFVQWANHPSQTNEHLFNAIQFLDRLKSSPNNSAYYDYANLEQQIAIVKNGSQIELQENSLPLIYERLAWLMPWELERSRRVAHHMLAASSDWIARLKSLQGNDKIQLGRDPHSQFYDTNPPPYLRQARTSPLIPTSMVFPTFSRLIDINFSRYMRLRLALTAFRIDNDSYPNRLNQLVPKYLPEIPCDVFSGHDYFYEPKGLDHPIIWEAASASNTTKIESKEILRSGPFLLPWSSAGGQRLFSCEVIYRAADGMETGIEKTQCYNVRSSNWQLFPQVDFRLLENDKKIAE